MFTDILKKIPTTTILLTYLFICGVLYIIGFWSLFNIDISNLVTITDIPKSFVFPFVISQGLFLFNMLTQFITASTDKDPENSNQDNLPKQGFIRRFLRVYSLLI